MNSGTTKTILSWFIPLSVGLLLSTAVPVEQTASLKFVRTIDTDDLFSEDMFSAGNPGLSGADFPPGVRTLHVFNQFSGGANFVIVTPPKHKNEGGSSVACDC